MKFIKITYLFFIGLLALGACTDPDEPYVENISEGGLLDVQTRVVNYIVGSTDPLTIEALAYQGTIKTTSVDVYVTFNTFERDANGALVYRNVEGVIASPTDTDSTTTALSSNEVLFTTLTPGTTSGMVSFSVDYAALASGLTIANQPFNGGIIPANDGELMIGDSWIFRFSSQTSEGNSYTNYQTATVSVATRFAGRYRVVEGTYFRIGVNRDDVAWPDEMTIASIDAQTYQQVEYFGAFDGNTLYFQIGADKSITYPATWDGVAQTGNGEPLTTCDSNPNDLSNVTCAGSNIAIISDDGRDQLIMTYGYFTGGSGAREFYQVLEKIVD